MGRTDGGKKGSQLSQLKQSIRTSGLSRVSKLPVNGRTGDRSGKKAKSSISSATKDPEFRLKKLAVCKFDFLTGIWPELMALLVMSHLTGNTS